MSCRTHRYKLMVSMYVLGGSDTEWVTVTSLKRYAGRFICKAHGTAIALDARGAREGE